MKKILLSLIAATLALPLSAQLILPAPPQDYSVPPQLQNEQFESIEEYLTATVQYPRELEGKKTSGVAIVSFVVDRQGRLKSLNDVSATEPAMAAELKRAINSANGWIPAMHNGKPTPGGLTITMPFSMEENQMIKPSFRGLSWKEFQKYIQRHFRYPKECVRQKIGGVVNLSFVIGKDGLIKDIKIMKSPHGAISKEMVRVIKSSPRWIPGFQNGKPVEINLNMSLNMKP